MGMRVRGVCFVVEWAWAVVVGLSGGGDGAAGVDEARDACPARTNHFTEVLSGPPRRTGMTPTAELCRSSTGCSLELSARHLSQPHNLDKVLPNSPQDLACQRASSTTCCCC